MRNVRRLGSQTCVFTDGLLLFARGDKISITMMIGTSEKFSNSIGLKVNQNKCCIYFGGVDNNTKNFIQDITRFEEVKMPFRYLSIHMSRKNLTVHHYMRLIDIIVNRITHWSSRLLSYVGGIQLLRSVIVSMMN